MVNFKILKIHFIFTLFIIFFAFKSTGTEQQKTSSTDDNTIGEIEAILNTKSIIKDNENTKKSDKKNISKKQLKKLNVSDYSNVISEASYNDYSVIQRNYMPKTSRLQIKGALTNVTNDAFYDNFGLTIGTAYHFNETWGIGGHLTFLNSNPNDDAKNILNVQGVNIQNLVTINNSYGVSAFFTPIYGKWSLLNRRIIPFEIYFHGGIAQITNQSNNTSSALTAGAGQLITLSRSSALDLNLNWHFYTTQNINGNDQAGNSILFSVGYSIFWPEPEYR